MSTDHTQWNDETEFHLPKDHWPLPELTHLEKQPRPHPSANSFQQMRASADYQQLRKSFTGFAFPMVITFVGLYFVFVLTAVYAPGFMGTKVIGNINVGVLFGLLNFATTYLVTWLYVRHANKNLDPLSTKLREQIEAGA